jgi:hypothetical protein
MLMNRTMGSLTYGVSKVRFHPKTRTYCLESSSRSTNSLLGRYYPLRRAPCWSIPPVSHLYHDPMSVTQILFTSTIYNLPFTIITYHYSIPFPPIPACPVRSIPISKSPYPIPIQAELLDPGPIRTTTLP